MNKKPMFSIIVPVYQCKDFLRETVASLQKQTFRNIEIILVDDGSTDGSSKICDDLASQDNRIVVFHESNQGVSVARNHGIKISRGKWLIFVDSDDIVNDVMCEIFYQYIVKDSAIDVLSCTITRSLTRMLNEVSINPSKFYMKVKNQNIELIKSMLLGNYDNFTDNFKQTFGNNIILNSPCAKAYRKSFIDDNNLQFKKEVSYAEDLLFNIEVLSCAATMSFIDIPVYFYRNNLRSTSHMKYAPGILKNYKFFKERLVQVFKDKKIDGVQLALDLYVLVATLTVIPLDIFRVGYSIKESKKRLEQVTDSNEIKELINFKILKEIKTRIKIKDKIKAQLLLKKRFWSLFIIYKILK